MPGKSFGVLAIALFGGLIASTGRLSAQTVDFSYSGSIQLYTITESGFYEITAGELLEVRRQTAQEQVKALS